MLSARRESGVTLIELIVVICVIAVLSGILVPVISYARGRSQVMRCAANLTQISVAAKLYHDDHHGPPQAELPDALGDYLDSREVFICPADRVGTDSYSDFFVVRAAPTTAEFLVGCPRHERSRRGAVAFGEGACDATRLARVTWNGSPLEPGDVVMGGELSFSDGSTVAISSQTSVGVLMSFSDDGVTHSVIWIPKNSFGRIDCSITPGSRFEVITPAAIAGVHGTKFTIRTSYYGRCGQAPRYITRLQVTEGKVKMQSRSAKTSVVVEPGPWRKATCLFAKAPRDPCQDYGGGGNGGDDDDDDDDD